MKIKEEKGITGIDITISILVITLFVSLLITLFYNLNANSQTIQRRTEATNIAINLIEKGNVAENSPYYQTISVIDFSKMKENQEKTDITSNLVKKVTVEISYKDRNQTESVRLSTILSARE